MATLREVKKRIRTVVSRLVFMVIVLTLLAASSSSGFDGNRKGVVFGAGLGYAPTTGRSGKLQGYPSSIVRDRYEDKAGGRLMYFIVQV